MNTLTLRKATQNDIPVISAKAKPIWQTHYVPIIGQQQVDYMLEMMYTPEKLQKQFDDGHVFYMIETNDTVIGYIAVSNKTPGDYMLHKFYMDGSAQGKGHGSKAFAILLQELGKINTLRLTVNRKNFKSINFYFKQGFTIEEVKDFDIGSGYLMEDFVMLRKG